jgi:hypothetical protein
MSSQGIPNVCVPSAYSGTGFECYPGCTPELDAGQDASIGCSAYTLPGCGPRQSVCRGTYCVLAP